MTFWMPTTTTTLKAVAAVRSEWSQHYSDAARHKLGRKKEWTQNRRDFVLIRYISSQFTTMTVVYFFGT
jgi:hypothetical protein